MACGEEGSLSVTPAQRTAIASSAPLPIWVRCLVRAAGIQGQLKDRAPDSPLFPLITAQGGEQLRLTATGIRYKLGHHR